MFARTAFSTLPGEKSCREFEREGSAIARECPFIQAGLTVVVVVVGGGGDGIQGGEGDFPLAISFGEPVMG